MKLVYTFMLLLLPCVVPAKKQGQARIDSLLKEVLNAKNDTNKVKILNDLSISLSSIDPDQGIKYGQQGLDLGTLLDWKEGISRAYSVLGTNYHVKSDYTKALEYDFTALKINEDIGNKKGIAGVTNNIGLFYQNQGNYPKALEYYFRSLKINEEMGYKDFKAANLANIGEVYVAQNNYAVALEYDFRALKLFQELDNGNGVANQQENIGNIYSLQQEYAKALEYFFKSLKLNENNGNKSGIAISLACIGTLYLKEKQYAEALEYFSKALRIDEELSNKNGVGINLGNIGEYYLDVALDTGDKKNKNKAADIDKSIEYLDKCIAICKEVGDLGSLGKFSRILSDAYIQAGKYKQAYESYQLYAKMKDSIFSMANKVKIANIETDREIALKDKQIEIDRLDVKKTKNERVFFISGIILLLMVAGFMLRNYHIQRKSSKLISQEKQRSEDLLLNILPAEVADELKHKGSAEARYYDNVTVIFTDFVNFTKAGERMSPQELINELHNCFKAFDEIVTKYNIEKIKTIGDAYLAVSGLPLADARHAAHAVAAAIEINAFMCNRRTDLKDKTFEVRIGIHTGSVVAGIVGVKKFAYDIWGDTVNTTARMEEHSEAGKINISQTTYDLVKDEFACTYRGEIEAKNKGQLKMYFVETA